ncbi:sugar nucleotide-binding protein [Pandoraea sp. PE-S2R-1]|uniref:SDR family oxidoreductase n=1 Tax=Pandoraea sp. PE-S2R-1 TaxID=1986994 RepID=UPI000B3FA7B8|nr:sugar nucleotide-binding protein [Pandoraea sp. PE-S2R-1]
MNLLISGAGGLLGGALVKLATARGHACTPLNRSQVRLSLAASAAEELDALFANVDHFVHAAANTNVEHCEAEPSACHRDNVLLTELLAAAARRCGVPMTFISSTGVYGAFKTTPYAEYDDARPETQHHRSKLRAEQLVLAAEWSNLVVRTGWLFGGGAQAPKNFVARRILEARAAQDGFISSNQQQRGCPTLVDDLADRLLDLIGMKARGVFNVVNEGNASRFEYVREILSLAGVAVEVRPVAAGQFNRIAPVSDNEMAVNWRADELGLPPLRAWQTALADYLSTDDMRALTA